MEFYVMRHGETVWNSKGITQGISNNMLSKKGKEQAFVVAEKMKDIKIDFIISSPLRRTIQTANIVNKFHKAKIVKNDKITEVDQGIFTGRKYSELSNEEKQQKATRSKEFGMESIANVLKRTTEFVDELKQNYKDKVVLVVTHNVVASMIELLVKYEKFDKEKFSDLKLFENAEIKNFEL